MTFVLRAVGSLVLFGLLLVAGFFGDALWNNGRLFYLAMGRDELVRDCTPLTKENLIGKGFSPVDLTFGNRPSIAFASGAFGQSKTFSDAFTFSDGPEGQRVDGALVCTVAGKDVKVEVQVESLPLRAT